MHIAVTAIGADRPGIVAAVTEVLHAADANIEDSRMATLGGHFAMMLIVALPAGVDAAGLESALAPVAERLELTVSARAVAAPADEATGEPYVVSVYGADHPGIVARVSALLASRDISIADLATHVAGDEPPVYVMVMEVLAPPAMDAAALERDLKALGTELSVDVSIHPMEPDTL